MKKVVVSHNYIVLFFFAFCSLFAQEIPDFEAVDSLYREDQFYVGITYNTLKNKPYGVSQNSFSTGIQLGILRDFPINKKRNIAIAPGLGFSYNNYKENLVISEDESGVNYSIIPQGLTYDKNKLALYFVDIPIEFRWRTSTPNSHKFWRIYSGFKLSYLMTSRARYFDKSIQYKVNNVNDINKFQYGVYLTSGWNSVNLYVYYGLQDIFKKGNLNGNPLSLNTFNIGFQFYIL